MEEIDSVLQAEKDADCIRQNGQSNIESMLKEAEEQRQQLLENARERGEIEKERLIAQARARAESRCMELDAVAAVKDVDLRERALKAMERTASWLAERIAEV